MTMIIGGGGEMSFGEKKNTTFLTSTEGGKGTTSMTSEIKLFLQRKTSIRFSQRETPRREKRGLPLPSPGEGTGRPSKRGIFPVQGQKTSANKGKGGGRFDFKGRGVRKGKKDVAISF